MKPRKRGVERGCRIFGGDTGRIVLEGGLSFFAVRDPHALFCPQNFGKDGCNVIGTALKLVETAQVAA